MGRPFTVAATSGAAALRQAIVAMQPHIKAAMAADRMIVINESLL
jgi:hypothetical protein